MNTIITKLNEYRDSNCRWFFPENQSEISAKDFCYRIDRAVVRLNKLGIKQGDRVGLLLDNSLDYAVLLYAVWVTRAIAVPLHQKTPQSTDYGVYLEFFHQACEFSLLFFDDPQLQAPLQNWGAVSGVQVCGTCSLEQSDTPVEQPLRLETNYPDDLTCFLQFSSGSTGLPKAVEVTHKMIMAQAEAMVGNHNKHVRGVTETAGLEMANWLPFSHNLGLFAGIIYPVFVRANNTIVSLRFYQSSPTAWFKLLSEKKIEANFSTNSILAMSLRPLANLEASDLDLSSLQLYLGGEKVSPLVVQRTEETLARFNFKPQQIHLGYGLSENTLSATSSKTGRIETHYFLYGEDRKIKPVSDKTPRATALCSIGEANHNCTITIRDENEKILPDLNLGEIHIEGPCVMNRYYRNPAQTDQVLKGNRLKTSDLGFAYNGEFFYHSRKDDLVIVGGRNFVPDDIELTVESLEFVSPGCSVVIMVEDEKTGLNKPLLMYEPVHEPTELERKEQRKEIQKMVYSKFNLLVNSVITLPAGGIEKTSTGKKKRKVIKAKYLSI